ncbi:MAG: ferritin-like domain-containing protein [Elusimicrobia bacterium]|nr:ferritin-like domain-containing protein [Elusimicrobiota bacterium]
MDWKPFVVCSADEDAPKARGFNAPDGLGDRLRTAAFAERQAAEAFRWAAESLGEAPEALRAAWRELSGEENKHLGWILGRMAQLGVDPAARPVSDRLWRSLTACRDHREFARLMARAEERGKAAEESFRRSLAERDPATADLFGRIAEEEERHIALQGGFV